MAKFKDADYPEMKRGITAFIQLLVQARKEDRIIERLFELDEVREIHSVHGDIDILVKVELTRNLLISDAETIGQFVHEKIRQLSGINSTKTLIPGFSKVKD
jgi:DNA-binding Lrp family transcriptional regulator